MIQDIQGILPPLEFTLGKRYNFLQDIKNAGSYTEKKVATGTEFTVSSKDVNGALMIRNANLQAGALQLLGEPTSHNLWQTIENIIDACNDANNPNPAAYIGLKYLFIEANAAILDDIVPNGIRLADGVLQFKDWSVQGDSAQPFKTSSDNAKVILRCHLGSEIVGKDELKTWIDYSRTSDKNIKLLTYFQYADLLESPLYTTLTI